MPAMAALVASAFYGPFGVANYSVSRGLWKEKLGLEAEDLEG